MFVVKFLHDPTCLVEGLVLLVETETFSETCWNFVGISYNTRQDDLLLWPGVLEFRPVTIR